MREKQPVFSPPKDSFKPPDEAVQTKTDVPVEKSEPVELNNLNQNITENLENKSNEKPTVEEDIVRQVRSSVEKEKATVKVISFMLF